jgi:hypothetical protein
VETELDPIPCVPDFLHCPQRAFQRDVNGAEAIEAHGTHSDTGCIV